MTIGGPSKVLPAPPHVLMSKGEGRKDFPLLIGCTKHDGTFALCDMFDVLTAYKIGTKNTKFNSYKMIEYMMRRYGIDDFSGSIEAMIAGTMFTKEEMKNGNMEEMLEGFVDLTNYVMNKAPIFKAAKAHQFHNPNTFLYTFNYKGQHTRFGYGKDTSIYPFDGGVHHSDDNIYLFPNPYPELNEEDKKMAQRMVNLWTSFAINGEPKADDVASWPRMDSKR